MRRLRAFAAIIVAAACAACSLVVGFDGFVGSAGNGDASVDAHTDGANPVGDGGVTDSSIADARPDAISFCMLPSVIALSPVFCDDFDESADAAPFTDEAQFPPSALVAKVGVDPTESSSVPNSLSIALSSGLSDDTNGRYVLLGAPSLPGVIATHSATWRFDMRIDSADPGAEPFLAQINFGTTTSFYGVSLFAGVSGSGLQEEIPDDDGGFTFMDWPASRALPLNTWTTVLIKVDFQNQQLTLVDDGETILTHAMSEGNFAGPVTIALGVAYYVKGTVAYSLIHFDNVIIGTN